VSFFDNVKIWKYFPSSKLLGLIGSQKQRLIEYVLVVQNDNQYNKNEIFLFLCKMNHLLVAQWFFEIEVGDIDIHVNNDEAFRQACGQDHLFVAQWLSF
jgi:hypothetical protein